MSLSINRQGFARLRPQVQADSNPLAQFKRPTRRAPVDAERAVQTSARVVDPDASVKSEAQSLLKEQFGELAGDRKAFHDLMKKTFGKGYDATKAEQYRQAALKGNFDWLPPIRFVSAETLGGANGAYDAESGVVYLNEDLKSDPSLAAQTYVEEAGHHLDQKLNGGVDTRGDEGEMFRRLLGGEALTQKQIQAIRNENDKGTIQVDGKAVEVEFWNPIKAIGKAVKKVAKGVGNAVKSVAKGVGKVAKGIANGVGKVAKGIANGVGKVAGFVWNGVKSVAKGAWNGVKSVAKGAWNGVKNFGTGIVGGAVGFFKNLFKGRIGEAFKSVVDGLDKAFIQAPKAIVNGVVNGAQNLFNGVAGALGPLGGPLRWVGDRVFDAGRSVVNGVYDTVSGIGKNVAEGVSTFVGGLGKIVTGDFKEGFKDLGMGLLKTFVQTPVDAVLLGAGKAISAIQTLIGLEPPGRKLTSDEIVELRKVYGDSIDYSQVRVKEGSAGLFSTNPRPFTHGNTIYLKDHAATPSLLVHEMGHVWQHQNGGTDYMSEAIYADNWGDGYNWEKGLAEGKSWGELNPEQQAELLEAAYKQGFFDDEANNRFMDGTIDRTDQLKAALEEMRAGRGAP